MAQATHGRRARLVTRTNGLSTLPHWAGEAGASSAGVSAASVMEVRPGVKTIEVQVDDKTLERIACVTEKYGTSASGLITAVLRHANWDRMLNNPVLGSMRVVGPILRTTTTVDKHRPPPALGADGDAVLRDAGYDAMEIGRLAEAGAFGLPASGAQE